MTVTSKDRALVAQIAGALAATYNRGGRQISNLDIARDCAAFAAEIVYQVDRKIGEIAEQEKHRAELQVSTAKANAEKNAEDDAVSREIIRSSTKHVGGAPKATK